MTARQPRSLAERAYRRLTRLLPAEFRGDFGDSMLRDVADQAGDQSGRARAALWRRELPALVLTAARQHLDDLRRDLGFALRMMSRTPGFTAAAVLMLALGTGANAAMFSVIDAVLLRSEFDDADRVVIVQERSPNGSVTNGIPLTHLPILTAATPALAAVSPVIGSLAVLTGAGDPHRIDIECVSPAMFRILGVQPLLGRVFTADEDRADGPPVVVLGYRAWMRDFGGAPDIIGRQITLAGAKNTVIGVMPEGYLGAMVRNRTEGWAPFAPALAHQSAVGCNIRGTTSNAIARIGSPFTRETAEQQLNAAGLLARVPNAKGEIAQISFERADFFTYEGVRAPFLVLLGAVGCVLLIACANVANLQLERLIGRRREIAMRLALGASRGRLIRQTLTENLLLSLLGAGAGLLAANLTLSTLVGMMPANVPHLKEIAIGSRTLWVTLGTAIAAGLAVGLAPAWQATATRVAVDLKGSSRGVAGGARWLRRGLVIGEVALSVVLLIGAALMIRTFLVLRPTTPGFDTSRMLVADVSLGGGWTIDPARLRFVEDVLARIQRLPGVASVSVSSYLPFSGTTMLNNVRIGDKTADVWSSVVTTGYLRDMNIPVVAGRAFQETDTAGAPPVMIINEAAARRFFPGVNPVGLEITVKEPDARVVSRHIVGVVGDTRSAGLDTTHRSQLYEPFAQEPGASLIYLMVRTTATGNGSLAAGIRDAVGQARPGQIVENVDWLEERLARSVSRPRFGAWLFSLFGAIAAGLASLGLAAVIAWWVAQRQREIGVRLALGASSRQVTSLILKQGLSLAFTGVVIGTGLAALASSLLSDWLYGVTPTDWTSYAVCAAAMLLITGVASYLPALRATRIDPLAALRAE